MVESPLYRKRPKRGERLVTGVFHPSVRPITLLTCILAGCSQPVPHVRLELPARFVADRVFLDARLQSGDSLVLFTDIGGGTFLYSASATRVGIRDSGALLPDILLDSTTIPVPLGAPGHLVPIFQADVEEMQGFDGMLGQAWFADRVWTIDYDRRRLFMHLPSPPTESHGRGATWIPRRLAGWEGAFLSSHYRRR
jgi:hypothetical protein